MSVRTRQSIAAATRCAWGLTALSLVLAGLVACGPAPAPATAAAPPPAEVGVVTVVPASVGLVVDLPGRTEASRVAQVRARTAGIVQRQLFREGSDVRAGQPLFQIDDAPYRATLSSAQAALARAEANLMQARAQADRYKPLVEARAVSQQDYVAAQAAQKQAEADVAAGKAAVQTAQINVGYAAVAAPISGRIGRALVTEGALVGQGEATPLALVQQINPLYVNFTQPAAEVLRLRAAIRNGQLKRAGNGDAAAVKVVLEDGSVYPLPGRLLFSDLSVDPGTGQITLRAEVPNPKGELLPGLYVRVQIEQAQAQGAFVLPQQAVAPSAQGYTVQVVAADGKVSARPVKLGTAQGGQWVVLDGLKAGEQVVVDGFQKIRPNVPVKPVAWTAPAAPAATAAAVAASVPASATAGAASTAASR
ncbi:MAG: efflux RND transporter periplasmic adaptor subunit [Rubrivivax sp.]|nr:efflux RND transporter periplasmic adaptor subunit [Rubrivivax sp.]MBK8526205.1 efflux RND transporter periplasmic adaptor subunit [Rubrivivax sp.]